MMQRSAAVTPARSVQVWRWPADTVAYLSLACTLLADGLIAAGGKLFY
jgi:hypothetical protein